MKPSHQVIFVCNTVGFPNGTAPSARVNAYGRGLVGLGVKVNVLCLETSEDPKVGIFNQDVTGQKDGIQFEYTSGATVKGSSFLLRRWLSFKGIWVGLKRVFELSRQAQSSIVILYGDYFVISILFAIAARLSGSLYLLEKSEKPFYTQENHKYWKYYVWLYKRTIYKLFDGILVISDYLHEYFAPLIRSKARLLKIPILVDINEYAKQNLSNVKPDLEGRYIAYCGLLNEQKDGVETLMKAFARISPDFPDVTLCLIGNSYNNDMIPKYRGLAKQYHVENQVFFTGQLPRKEIPRYLAHATVLALARPSSPQAQAGFPTKLGEYLATGNPVAVTQVGELSSYLEDAVTVYFSPPDDVDAFSCRLEYILSHPDEARMVGENGQSVAKTKFDIHENALLLKQFIDSFSNSAVKIKKPEYYSD